MLSIVFSVWRKPFSMIYCYCAICLGHRKAIKVLVTLHVRCHDVFAHCSRTHANQMPIRHLIVNIWGTRSSNKSQKQNKHWQRWFGKFFMGQPINTLALQMCLCVRQGGGERERDTISSKFLQCLELLQNNSCRNNTQMLDLAPTVLRTVLFSDSKTSNLTAEKFSCSFW